MWWVRIKIGFLNVSFPIFKYKLKAARKIKGDVFWNELQNDWFDWLEEELFGEE